MNVYALGVGYEPLSPPLLPRMGPQSLPGMPGNGELWPQSKQQGKEEQRMAGGRV